MTVETVELDSAASVDTAAVVVVVDAAVAVDADAVDVAGFSPSMVSNDLLFLVGPDGGLMGDVVVVLGVAVDAGVGAGALGAVCWGAGVDGGLSLGIGVVGVAGGSGRGAVNDNDDDDDAGFFLHDG